MRLRLFLIGLSLLVSLGTLQAQVYNILDFGAKPNGNHINTKAIQDAIDHCVRKGGGEVLVPAGNFVTGTVFLKSGVYLHLLPGSVLQGSYDPADYPQHAIAKHKKFGTITHNGLYVDYMKALIIADNAQQVGIFGEGTIKGAGEGKAFQLGLNKDGKPKNIFFIGCKDVLLKGVRIFNSAQVTVSISGCDRVNIDGIYIRSLVNWNCDGLDVDARDVTISNCVIDSEDDALCFKSEYLGRFCENVTVTNCVVSSLCNGIKWGTGSRTGFRNFTVNNCVIKKASVTGYHHFEMTPDVVFRPDSASVNSGIVIAGVDGGLVENIIISDIVMTDVLSPIVIRIGKRFVTPDGNPSVLRQIKIQNVLAETRSIIPVIIAGLPESLVEDVQLTNIRIKIPISVTADSMKNFPAIIPESAKSYPENRMFGTKLPASAGFIRHVKDLSITDVSLTYDTPDARPLLYLENAHGVKIKGLLVNKMKVENARQFSVNNSKALEVTN